MKLLLYRDDLQPKFQGLDWEAVRFEHCTAEAQNAVRAVGMGQFWEMDFYADGAYTDIRPDDQHKTGA